MVLLLLLILYQTNVIELVKRCIEQWFVLELVQWALIKKVHLPLGALTHTHIILLAELLYSLFGRGASNDLLLLVAAVLRCR